MRPARGATTRAWCRWRAIGLLAAGSLVALSGCAGFFATTVPIPTLLVAPAVRRANIWEIRISVVDMPAGGLAGIAMQNGGLTTTDIDVNTLTANGQNGFLVWWFDALPPDPQGALCATHAYSGIESGEILVLWFQATGPAPSITIDGSKIQLGSDANTLIAPFDIAYDVSYHLKEVGGR